MHAIDATLTQGERVFALADPDDDPLPAETRIGYWLEDDKAHRVDLKGRLVEAIEIETPLMGVRTEHFHVEPPCANTP